MQHAPKTIATDRDGVSATPPVVTCFLLKVASRCNLACDYCYVYEHADQTWQHQPKLMSQITARMVGERLNEYMRTVPLVGEVTVVIHGGEPLLLGVSRMEALLQAIIGQLDDVKKVSFSIQTNGVLITCRWLELFHKYGVTVSISCDGPSDVNDLHRLDHFRRSTYGHVEDALNLLTSKYKDLLGGVLAVVDLRTDARHIITWAEDLGIPSIDFLLPDGTYEQLPPGLAEPGIRNNAAPYGRWLAEGFDCWYGSHSSLRVRLFENIVDLLLGGESRTEGIGPGHFSILTIETNGEIQDTDVMKITKEGGPRLGSKMSIQSMTFGDVLASSAVSERALLATSLPTTCKSCTDVEVCGAGHLPHRFSAHSGFHNPSIYCGDLHYLIRHIGRKIEADLRWT